jgi:hypothetical protein
MAARAWVAEINFVRFGFKAMVRKSGLGTYIPHIATGHFGQL